MDSPNKFSVNFSLSSDSPVILMIEIVTLLILKALVIIMILLLITGHRESMSGSSHENMTAAPHSDTLRMNRATELYNWMKNNPHPRYVNYRRDLGKKSNIVEYDELIRLKKEGQLTINNIVAFLPNY